MNHLLQSTRIVSLPDQDDTDFTKAVTYTIEQLSIETGQHIDFIVAVWKTGGRIDQCLSCINTLYKNVERMPIFLLDLDSSLSWMLKPVREIISLFSELVAITILFYNSCLKNRIVNTKY